MFRSGRFALFILLGCACARGQNSQARLGIFEGQNDVGAVLHPGAAEYDAAARAYTLSGSGGNMWFASDEFHFVWKKISAADVTLAADISILGSGGDAHRKGVLMIRQSFEDDSAYVDAARHGEGLTSLQFRETKGAVTHEIESSVSGPSRLRIEKHGDRFYLWIAEENGKLQFAGGSARVEMHAPFYVGIGVCAHDKNAVERASFTHVELETSVPRRKTTYSTVETVLLSGDARASYVSPDHLASPGWSPDGHSLTYERNGRRMDTPFTPLRTAAPVGAPVAAQPASKFLYFSSKQSGGAQVWRKKADGSEPEQLTSDDFSNVSPHLSPDGKTLLILSYPKDSEALPNKELELRIVSLADMTVKTLATFSGGKESLGEQPWSPDGKRVIFISYQSLD